MQKLSWNNLRLELQVILQGGYLVHNVFEFSPIEKCELVIQQTWAEFREQLADKKFAYNDIESARKSTFLRVFDDVFNHCHSYLEKSVNSILNDNTVIVRAARLKDGDSVPDYNRFIPKAEFIKNDNRFSPPGMEWLYLAFSPNVVSENLLECEKCALKECRAKAGDSFALCCFKPEVKYEKKTLIDLTIAKSLDFEHINANLEQEGQRIVQREMAKGYKTALTRGVIPKPQIEDIIPELKKWVVFTYAKLLADQIFLPITTEDKNLMYAPFQCMAQYFLDKGYAGIVYSSTVFPEGKNVVLFDKSIAVPYGSVKKVVIPVDL